MQQKIPFNFKFYRTGEYLLWPILASHFGANSNSEHQRAQDDVCLLPTISSVNFIEKHSMLVFAFQLLSQMESQNVIVLFHLEFK